MDRVHVCVYASKWDGRLAKQGGACLNTTHEHVIYIYIISVNEWKVIVPMEPNRFVLLGGSSFLLLLPSLSNKSIYNGGTGNNVSCHLKSICINRFLFFFQFNSPSLVFQLETDRNDNINKKVTIATLEEVLIGYG